MNRLLLRKAVVISVDDKKMESLQGIFFYRITLLGRKNKAGHWIVAVKADNADVESQDLSPERLLFYIGK